MIFVTVGSQLPFDRMIRAVDEIAAIFPDTEFVAQVFGMQCAVKNIRTLQFVSPSEFNNYISEAELVISHAGMGTILSVAEIGRPLIVFPRLGKLKETRNDHQVATCRMLEKQDALNVAYDKDDLHRLVGLHFENKLPATTRINSFASPGLINSLRSFMGQPQLMAG